MAEPIIPELLQIAGAYKRMRRFDKAEQLYKQILAIQTRNNLFETGDTAVAMYELGELYSNQGSNEKAIEYFKMALRVWDQIALEEPVPIKLRLEAKKFLKDQAHAIVMKAISSLAPR